MRASSFPRLAPVAVVAALAALLAACAPSPESQGLTQLEASAGVPPELAGQLTTGQLALLQHIQNHSQMSQSEKRRRIDRILAGASPITLFPL